VSAFPDGLFVLLGVVGLLLGALLLVTVAVIDIREEHRWRRAVGAMRDRSLDDLARDVERITEDDEQARERGIG
jgi:hypothetical protein